MWCELESWGREAVVPLPCRAGAGTAFAPEEGEGMSTGISRAKAVLAPDSSQGRKEVAVPSVLLARPAGLEKVSVPREQTFKQAGALCPSVSRAVTDPSTQLEAAQHIHVPLYPASKAGTALGWE